MNFGGLALKGVHLAWKSTWSGLGSLLAPNSPNQMGAFQLSVIAFHRLMT